MDGHWSPEDTPAGKGRDQALRNSRTREELAGLLGWEEVWVLGAGGLLGRPEWEHPLLSPQQHEDRGGPWSRCVKVQSGFWG